MERKQSRLSPEVTVDSKEPTLAKVKKTLDMLGITLAGLDSPPGKTLPEESRKAGCLAGCSAGEWLDRQVGSQ